MSTVVKRRGSAEKAEPTPKNKRARSDAGRAWALVAPALIVLAIVIGYPIVRAIWLSFQANRHLDPSTGVFVDGGFAGLDNYLYWIQNRCMSPSGTVGPCPPGVLATDFWPALGITLFFTVVTVALEATLGMVMALIMNHPSRVRSLVRAAVLIPWAIPTAVTAKLWQFMFAPNGIVNSLLGQSIAWTTDPWAARIAVIIADVWKTTPFVALLILAGLQMIPKDVYEAARVDGASAWQTFTRITLPLVRPTLMVAILFRALDALRMYDLPVIMISGSSNSPTATISQLVVEDMRQNNFNSASALSTLIFLLIFTVAFIMVRFGGADVGGEQTQRRRERRAEKRQAKKQKATGETGDGEPDNAITAVNAGTAAKTEAAR